MKIDVFWAENSSSNELQVYRKSQETLSKVIQFERFLQIMQILKINYLETTKPIFEGKNLHELVSDVAQKLGDPNFKGDLTHPIDILYDTKEMNPPWFFSLEFTIGTYMPLLAPFIMGLIQTIFKFWKEKRKEKSETSLKVKTE